MPTSTFFAGRETAHHTDSQEQQALTTSTNQYWSDRSERLESQIASLQAKILASDSDVTWKAFCAKGFSFLERLNAKAVDRLYAALQAHWNGNKVASRQAQQLFKAGSIVEILIPYGSNPLRFVKLSPRSKNFAIRPLATSDPNQRFSLGHAYLGVSWKGKSLFAISPTGDAWVMDTFYLESTDGQKLSTSPILQEVFRDVAKEFKPDLRLIEERFCPYMELLIEQTQLENVRRDIAHLERSKAIWSSLHLPATQIIELLKALDLFEASAAGAPQGILLSGPSGVGKSLIGKALADSSGCYLQHLTPASLKQNHIGASGQRVKEVWELARLNQPSIIFIDECESVLGRRGAAETDVIATEIVQAFLAEWDGLNKSQRIWVIGATNRPDQLDDAILSRFGWEMKIALPSQTNRLAILAQELSAAGVPNHLSSEFGSLTQGMSGRDLQEIARKARRAVFPEMPTLDDIRESITRHRSIGGTSFSSKERWKTLILGPDLIHRLSLLSGLLREAETWSARGVTIPQALLLEGPSGVGKTQIARTFANETGLTFIAVTSSDLMTSYVGQSGNRVQQLFQRARSHAPCVLFLDELDIVAADRAGGADDPLTREIIGQLMQEMDSVPDGLQSVFLIAATDRANSVDQAILNRFPEKISIPLPDREARFKLFGLFLKDKSLAFQVDNGAALLADLTEGKSLTVRKLRDLVVTAEQSALLRAVESGGPEHYVITLDDFSSVD